MIPTEQLIYGIDQRLNKLSTNVHQGIPIMDKVIALNNAQLQLIKLKIDRNNNYSSGLDSSTKRIDELQSLIVESNPLDLVLEDKNKYKYSSSTINLDPKYMFYVDSYILADKGNCTDRVLVGNRIGISNLQVYQANSNMKSSFEYQESLVTVNNNSISVYSDGTFTPKKIIVTYIKYPIKIDFPGYYHFDDTESILVNCELPEFLKDELLDITVRELALATENVPAIEASNVRTKTDE